MPNIREVPTPHRLKGDEVIDHTTSTTVIDFWAWAYSDLLVNTNRAVFAEYLVALALGVSDVLRLEWDAVDVRYREHGIEVKASAYIQSWPQTKLSPISFDIAEKKGWYAPSNTYAPSKARSADCYVFCLYSEEVPVALNVLNLDKWKFYVVITADLERVFGKRKRITLSQLEALTTAVGYSNLKSSIDSALDNCKVLAASEGSLRA